MYETNIKIKLFISLSRFLFNSNRKKNLKDELNVTRHLKDPTKIDTIYGHKKPTPQKTQCEYRTSSE